MRKIRDVLRLSAAGSKRKIAASLGVSATAADRGGKVREEQLVIVGDLPDHCNIVGQVFPRFDSACPVIFSILIRMSGSGGEK